MTAAYRLKGLGWLAMLAGVALALYLLSLQVAVERKKLDGMDRAVAAAERDIRALETEFNTRANLVQLERWNGDTLALAAPTPAQFVTDDNALAMLDPNGAPGGEVRTAALVVPSIGPAPTPVPVPVPGPVTATPSAPAPAPPAAMPAAPARVIAVAAVSSRPALTPAVQIVAPTGRAAPAIARAAEAARGAAAVARVRPQAVALLDRQLLSDTTFGDIMSGARRESRR